MDRRRHCRLALRVTLGHVTGQRRGSPGSQSCRPAQHTSRAAMYPRALQYPKHVSRAELAMPPNPAIDRSAKQLRCLVPVALCAPAPGHCER